MTLSKRRQHLKDASGIALASKRRRKAEELSSQIPPLSPPLPPEGQHRRVLSLEQDFKEQKGKMQEVDEGKGHLAAFYPKFHCEINWIEYYWGMAKRFARDNCEYNFGALCKSHSSPASIM